MPSSKEYLDYVLEQLNMEDLSYRMMMGEFVLYYQDKVIGGIYDDRFLLKPTKGAIKLMEETYGDVQMDLPYEGAKEMLAADIDDKRLCRKLIEIIAEEVPSKKKKKRYGNKMGRRI